MRERMRRELQLNVEQMEEEKKVEGQKKVEQKEA